MTTHCRVGEARICMTCGNMDRFQNGFCSECGSDDLSYECEWPTVRDNEYPTYEELLQLRKEGKLA